VLSKLNVSGLQLLVEEELGQLSVVLHHFAQRGQLSGEVAGALVLLLQEFTRQVVDELQIFEPKKLAFGEITISRTRLTWKSFIPPSQALIMPLIFLVTCASNSSASFNAFTADDQYSFNGVCQNYQLKWKMGRNLRQKTDHVEDDFVDAVGQFSSHQKVLEQLGCVLALLGGAREKQIRESRPVHCVS
jgi:hypothetical protein